MSTYAQALFILLAAAPALANDNRKAIQIPVGGAAFPINGMLPNSQFSLLRDSMVQAELKITEEQNNRVEEAVAKVDAARLKWAQQLGKLRGPADKAKRLQLTREVNDKRNEISQGVIDGLKPVQIKRLREISIQLSGIRALEDQKVARQLKITEEQQAKMEEVAADVRMMRRQLSTDIRAGTVPANKYVERREEIGKEAEFKTLEVLTEQQRRAFDKMKGKKFSLPQRVRTHYFGNATRAN